MGFRGMVEKEKEELRQDALRVMAEFDLTYRQVARWIRKTYGYEISRSGVYFFLNQ